MNPARGLTKIYRRGEIGVQAPTHFIVGQRGEEVAELCRQAHAELRCVNELAAGAGRDASLFFEEPGTLEQAACHARVVGSILVGKGGLMRHALHQP